MVKERQEGKEFQRFKPEGEWRLIFEYTYVWIHIYDLIYIYISIHMVINTNKFHTHQQNLAKMKEDNGFEVLWNNKTIEN